MFDPNRPAAVVMSVASYNELMLQHQMALLDLTTKIEARDKMIAKLQRNNAKLVRRINALTIDTLGDLLP